MCLVHALSGRCGKLSDAEADDCRSWPVAVLIVVVGTALLILETGAVVMK